jgi:rhamnose utilization protein RhaD (predicted bifunctional aldolase and dehydrogenase)
LYDREKRVIAHYTDHEDALVFAGSKWAEDLGKLGTSCPDHFLRTRICCWRRAKPNPRLRVVELVLLKGCQRRREQ